MTDLQARLLSLNKEQGAKVLLYCDLRGMQRDLVVRGIWGIAILGLAMVVLNALGPSEASLLAPYLDWMGIGICLVALLYGGISLFMVWSIRATRLSLYEIGVHPGLVEQLDAIPSKSLARRRVEQEQGAGARGSSVRHYWHFTVFNWLKSVVKLADR